MNKRADSPSGPKALACRLARGLSLRNVIMRAPCSLPPEAALAAEMGHLSGDLSGALRATTYDNVFDRTLIRPTLLRLVYVVPVMLFFVTFMKIKIEPSMMKIFSDFDSQLPEITREVFYWTNGMAYLELVLPLTLLGIVVLVPLTWLQWTGRTMPNLPWLARLIRWVDAPAVLRMLALGTRREVPLPATLRALALCHPKASMRRRIAVWRRTTWSADAPGSTACTAQVIERSEAAILDSAQRSGNLPWALDELAESLERRANYRLQSLAQIVLPLALLPTGLLVGALAVAYFAPLTTLIWNLSR